MNQIKHKYTQQPVSLYSPKTDTKSAKEERKTVEMPVVFDKFADVLFIHINK